MEQCETPHGNLNIFYQILIFIRHTLVPAVDIKSKVEHFFSASKPWRKQQLAFFWYNCLDLSWEKFFQKWVKSIETDIILLDWNLTSWNCHFWLKIVGQKWSRFFFIILNLNVTLQRYRLNCQANSAFLGRYFCTGQQQLNA